MPCEDGSYAAVGVVGVTYLFACGGEDEAQQGGGIVNMSEGMEMGEAFVYELEEHVLLCVFRA